MLKSILPLGIDEIIAIIVLGLTLIFPQVAFFSMLQGLVIFYLIMCIGFRKYEAIQEKYHTPNSSSNRK